MQITSTFLSSLVNKMRRGFLNCGTFVPEPQLRKRDRHSPLLYRGWNVSKQQKPDREPVPDVSPPLPPPCSPGHSLSEWGLGFFMCAKGRSHRALQDMNKYSLFSV